MQLIHSNSKSLYTPSFDWYFGIDENIEWFISKLSDIMVSYNAMGIAAPQVGINKRVFIIRNYQTGEMMPFINPIILDQSDKVSYDQEGCISFPNLYLWIPRPKKITAKYLDINGNSATISLEGINARCFAHENDHINGICFTSHVDKNELTNAMNKRKNAKKHTNKR